MRLIRSTEVGAAAGDQDMTPRLHRKGNDLKTFKDFNLQAWAKFWPWLS